jgi:choline dehydrogenase-like flavoprotein
MQMILSLAIDEAHSHNHISIGSDGEPVINYDLSDAVIKSLVASVKASLRIFFAAGATRAHAPGAKTFFISKDDVQNLDSLITPGEFKRGKISITAAHLMGGCRMGGSPRTSVTDPWGRVHGKKDIYVADSSLFPAASEVNPYLTIMALADRVAEAVQKDFGA